MAGAATRRTAIAPVVTVLAASAFAAPVVRGAEPGETVALPGSAVSAITADVDRDGSRELIRITSAGALEVWAFRSDAWQLAGSVRVPGSAGTAPPSEAPDMAALFTVRDGPIERVLLASGTTGPAVEEASTVCCLAIAEVQRLGSDIRLVPRWDGSSGADAIRPADLDGDGVDELVTEVTSYTDDPEAWTHDVAILRWTGGGFEPIFEERSPDGIFSLTISDTDGVAGDDVLMGPSSTGDIRRVVATDGGVRVERGRIVTGEAEGETWLVGTAGGTLILQGPAGPLLVDWPSGGEPVVDDVPTLEPFVHAVLGSGPEAVMLAESPASGSTTLPTTVIYDVRGTKLGEVDAAPLPAAVRQLFRDVRIGTVSVDVPLYPYFGPLPGGLDGRDAYVMGGTLVQPGGDGGFDTRTISPMIARSPIGPAGPDGAWMVTTNGFFGPPPGAGAYLFPYGGQPDDFGALTIVPMSEILSPRSQAIVSINPTGTAAAPATAEEEGEAGVERLLAPGDGFRAVVTGPASSLVLVRDGPILDQQVLTDQPLVVQIDPRRNAPDDRDVPFERSIVVVLPSGHVAGAAWEGTFMREDPVLTASAATRTFTLSATVAGSAEGAAIVTVDGRPADLAATGTFAVDVEAPIWPRQVVVVARDLVGNEATVRLEIVGLADYRGLPWAPILAAATVAAGMLLFVRTPRLRARSARRWDDDVVLEEVE